MNLVQKEHLALTQIRKDRRKIALNLASAGQRSAGSLHLVRWRMMEARVVLAQSGRPKEQNMIERLAARLSRFERNGQLLLGLLLTDEFLQPAWTEI